jgi:outer membrane immunogenic protein
MWKRLSLASAGFIALTGVACAADMPVKASPLPPPPPTFSWTGFYLGGQVGWLRANDDGRLFNPGVPVAVNSPFTFDMNSVIGGVHAGYDQQFGQWVLGIVGSYDWANLNTSGTVGICPLFCGTGTTKVGAQGSLRGRVGFAFDRLLLYGTGGVVVAKITNTYDTTAFGGGFASIESSHTGWTAGIGVAGAVTNNLSIFAEYRHSDFGTFTDRSSVAFFPATDLDRHVTEDQVQVGFSYRLGLH